MGKAISLRLSEQIATYPLGRIAEIINEREISERDAGANDLQDRYRWGDRDDIRLAFNDADHASEYRLFEHRVNVRWRRFSLRLARHGEQAQQGSIFFARCMRWDAISFPLPIPKW